MCCGFKCCLCITFSFITIPIVAISIFAIIFQPQDLKFTVTDASLAQFDLSSTDNRTLSYDLALNVTIRNPNKKVGVFFDRIQVIANYRKKRFSLATLNFTTMPFYQGHKNTTVLPTVRLQGQKTLSFKERDVEKYNSERNSGVFSIDVKLVLRARSRYGKIKIRSYGTFNKFNCDKLKVPLLISSSNSTFSSLKFKATKCSMDFVVVGPY